MRLALGLAAAVIGLAVNASAATCPQLDPDTVKCQQGIGRAGSSYVRIKMKAVQRCLNKIQSGDLTGDPVTVCRGTPGVPPTDQTTADKIARAEGRVADILTSKCSDPIVASLDVCAATVGGLATCLVADHFVRTDAAIAEEYGALVPSGDAGQQGCQAKIAKEAGKYLSTRAKAIAHCFDTRNKRICGTTDPLPNCLDPSETGGREEEAAARKIANAEAKMREKIGAECSDPEITALDACADTGTALGDCLVCTHIQAAALLVAGEYQAVHAASPTGPSLQSVADAADAGDTIYVEPGTYFGQTMELKKSSLSVIGLKTCDTGTRPLILNDTDPMNTEPNGIISCGSLSPGCTDVADGLLLQSLEVNNFEANDVLTVGADGVTYRDMITRGPGTNPGTEYGLFPVQSNDVLIEDSVVSTVRDAGIYVGQSTNIVIRNNEVFGNVAGLEVENSANAEVYGNYAHDNSGGILVFKLVLPVQYSNCHSIHDNVVTNNNGANYGSGLVGAVPVGTGMLILSNDTSVFRNNTVNGNDTFGIVLTDQQTLNLLYDPDFFPTPSPDQVAEYNSFVGNTQTGNGSNPDPFVPEVFGSNGAIVITGGSPGIGNCGDDLPRFCKLPPNAPCTNDSQCTSGAGDRCFGSYFWNVMPNCPVPPSQPNCPLVTTTSTTSTSVTTTSSSTSTTLLFTWGQVQGMFAVQCSPCHTSSSSGGLTGLHDFNLGYTNTVNAPSTERPGWDRIEPGDSSTSYLMHKLDGTHLDPPASGSGVRMPLGGPYLSQADRDGIRAWINSGAPQNP